MALSSFKELLLRKAEGNPGLQALVKHADEDYIFDLVTEALEKMARPAGHKGDTANEALRTFAKEYDPDTHGEMLRDAVGHHAAQYKAAVAAGNQNKANKHARKVWDMMNLASMLNGKLTDNKVTVDYPNPHPWDRHTKLRQVNADSESYKRGNRKLGDWSSATEGFDWAGKDFKHLQYPPHPGHGRTAAEAKKGNDRGYPMEQIKINGKYIPIDDQDLSQEDHPFDSHPIMQHYNEGSGAQTGSKRIRDPKRDEEYLKDRAAYENGPMPETFWGKMAALEEKDPEAYAARGSKPSAPVHGEASKPQHVIDWENSKDAPAPAAATTAPISAASASTPAAKPEEISSDLLDYIKQKAPKGPLSD